ncbi:hypothetical protein BDP27DRAFT_1352640 [Rhodocollybia butyracea]|uniref:Uncharacterized protein n=1 Tax=Rhodocollybia butyracea TaxID=206335 RepID=A0A9P5P4K7_9AGAR|nr:hypothetical protein BDP27DRAFT_1352640 [Rhodocollybia butyracea]
MALASARYAKSCVQLLQQLVATYLYTVCQAIDLRAMNIQLSLNLNFQMCWYARIARLFKIHLPLCSTTLRVQFAVTASMESMSRFKTMLSPLIAELYTRTAQNNSIQFATLNRPYTHEEGNACMDKHEIGTQITTIFQALEKGRMDSIFSEAIGPILL